MRSIKKTERKVHTLFLVGIWTQYSMGKNTTYIFYCFDSDGNAKFGNFFT